MAILQAMDGTGSSEKKILECVPNVSEGRDERIIRKVGEAFDSVKGARLLHVDSNPDANRTVYTIAGEPGAVMDAALSGARAIYDSVDMRLHSGAHPRIGALDVLPLVPIRGLSMESAAALARELGKRIAAELGVPIYFYAESASRPERRELSSLRRGGYEGLPGRFADPAWAPDSGPAEFIARWGATAAGAREVLIAWNVNLDSEVLDLARRIAAELRARGKANPPFPGLKAIGWRMPGYRSVQVSFNVTDPRRSPLREVYKAVDAAAARLGCRAAGSELIGLVPSFALEEAGKASMGEAGKTGARAPAELIAAGVAALGLESLRPFRSVERVLEYALADMEVP
jgi:glutamate formiminotransferase / formiminotetrahydrofolate cyclodeaminase